MLNIYELANIFNDYIVCELNIIDVVDNNGMQLEYEQLKSNFITTFEEVFFTLSDSDKHDFDVLAFDKYCKFLDKLGL